MRIANVIFMYHPFYGGAEVQAHLLARRFQSFGHDVRVLTMHFGETAHKEVLDGVPIVRVPYKPVEKGKWTGVIRALMNAFWELHCMRRVDVVYIHSAPFLLIPVFAFKKLYRVPIVLKMISDGVTAKSTILMTSRLSAFNWIKRMLLRNVDCFVCLNAELVAEVKVLVPNARCIRISNGVDCSYWERAFPTLKYKTAIGVEEQYRTAIFVGRLVPEKGVDVLLKIWSDVVARIPKVLLFIVGDGPLEREMRELAASLRISGNVRFAGSKPDVREFLFAMDAFLLFSPNEGMSNALLEAMAAGVPIVCSDNPGTSAIIHHMVNGIRVNPGEISQAAASVCRILEDKDFAAALAERARADVRTSFDISVTAKQYEQLFLTFTC